MIFEWWLFLSEKIEKFTWKCVKALFLKYIFLVYTTLHCQRTDRIRIRIRKRIRIRWKFSSSGTDQKGPDPQPWLVGRIAFLSFSSGRINYMFWSQTTPSCKYASSDSYSFFLKRHSQKILIFDFCVIFVKQPLLILS